MRQIFAKKRLDFEPSTVFRRLYLTACELAVNTQPHVHQLLSTFVSLTSHISDAGWTAVELHRSLLQKHQQILAKVFSRSSCLCCLSRSPERGLPCGHILCVRCIQTFGQRISPEQYIYSMPTCPLCGNETTSFRAHMKPPTAGVRLLSIDGGGVRGVLPLQALGNLEATFNRLTGLSGPIQEHFDLALGTSSGKSLS